MVVRTIAISLVTLALLAPAAARAQAQNTLTLEQALKLAEDRSLQLAAQGYSAASAREMAGAAGQRPDPVLKAGINNLPVSGSDRFSLTRDFMTMRSIGVSQEITRSDKLQARMTKFQREADAADAGKVAALANVQRNTALAWFDRYYQERLRDLLISQRDETRLQAEASEAAYRGGRGSQADVLAARSAVIQIEDRIDQAERQVATSKTRLSRWIGNDATASLSGMPRIDAVPLHEADLDAQLAHHPELAVMARQEEVAQAEAQIARTDRETDWSVELMYSQRGSAYSNMVSINLAVPLQWDQRNRQDKTLAAKLALVEKMRAEREEATRDHTAETQAMLQEWRSDRNRLSRYDTSFIPLAADRTRAAMAAYRGNGSTLSAVLEARRAEIDIRMERIRLEMETARLWAQLNYLVPAGHAPAAPAR
jgi:outer membrane protein TolC